MIDAEGPGDDVMHAEVMRPVSKAEQVASQGIGKVVDVLIAEGVKELVHAQRGVKKPVHAKEVVERLVMAPEAAAKESARIAEVRTVKNVEEFVHVPKVVTQRRRAQGCRRRSSSRKSSTRRGW